MKLGFFELEGWETEIIKRELSEHELFFSQLSLNDYSGDEMNFDAVSIFVNSKVDRETLIKFPNLKFITARCTGYDHIDAVACKERGIVASYVPGYGDNTVAEFAFGLILSLTRKIYLAIDQIKETGSFDFKGLRGIDIKGKTLGVIGTGRIGKESVKIGKGFGMNILGYDPYPNEEFAREVGMKYVSLRELLKNSDVITLHAPLNEETKHIINMENIIFVKKGAYLVNTARGPLVQTDALIYALQNKILAGVGIDVMEEEGDIKDEMKFLKKEKTDEEEMRTIIQNHILMRMPNVLMTPHNAFNSQEALERILNTTISNIKGFLEGKNVNVVML